MPVKYVVTIMPEVTGELEQIFAYLVSSSTANAKQQVHAIREAIWSLAELPHRFAMQTGRKSTRGPVRRIPVPPYVIYYRVDEAKREVLVVSVRHGARRRPGKFPG